MQSVIPSFPLKRFFMTPLVPGPCFKRCYDKERAYDLAEMRERFNLGETQVDRLGSILIMPRFLMEQTLRDYRFSLVLPVYGDNVLRSRDKLLLQKMADAVGASYSAFFNRLKELNMIERHTIDEYLELEMNFEGGWRNAASECTDIPAKADGG